MAVPFECVFEERGIGIKVIYDEYKGKSLTVHSDIQTNRVKRKLITRRKGNTLYYKKKWTV